MLKKNSIFIKKFEILKKYFSRKSFSGKLKFPEFIFFGFRKNIFSTHTTFLCRTFLKIF